MHLNGRLHGSETILCSNLSTPSEANHDSLVLCFQRNLVTVTVASNPKAVITTAYLDALFPNHIPRVIVEDQSATLTSLLEFFARPRNSTGGGVHQTVIIDPSSVIHPTAQIDPYVVIGAHTEVGENVHIEAGVVLGQHVIIESNCHIYPRAVILDNTQIGKDSKIGPGAVIGYDGFSIDNHILRPHLGGVQVGSHSSIGANSCVDKGTIGTTKIGHHTHLDNLVQVGHNTVIGDRTTLCGQVGISGSAKLGSDITVGGQAGFAQGVQVPSKTLIAAQTGVTKDIMESGRYSGHPAEPNQQRLRRIIQVRKLVEDSTS